MEECAAEAALVDDIARPFSSRANQSRKTNLD
jgi:hypothetical protein